MSFISDNAFAIIWVLIIFIGPVVISMVYSAIKHMLFGFDVQALLAKKDVGELRCALFHKCKQPNDSVQFTRSNAAIALGQIGELDVIPALVGALADRDVLVLQAAAQAIAQILQRCLRQPLFEAVKANDTKKAQERLKDLERIRKLAISPLSKVMTRMDDQRTALIAMGMLGGEQAAAVIYKAKVAGDVRVAALQALISLPDPQALKYVMAALNNDAWEVRVWATEIITNTGIPQVGSMLQVLLHDRHPLVILAAIKGLTKYPAVKAQADLLPLIGHTTGEVRRLATELLAVQGDRDWRLWIKGVEEDFAELGRAKVPQALEYLSEAINYQPTAQRCQAALGLGYLGDARAVPQLISKLADKEWECRRAALSAIGDLGQAEAVKVVFPLLADQHPELRQLAAEVLVKLGQTDHRNLIKGDVDDFDRLAGSDDLRILALFMQGPVTIHTIKALKKSDTMETRERLLSALTHQDKSICYAAIGVLGERRDRRIMAPCLRMLEQPDPHGKIIAVQALESLGDSEALEPLLKARQHATRKLRLAVTRCFGRLGSSAIPKLIEDLGDPDGEIRLAAVQALADGGDRRWGDWVKGDNQDWIRLAKAQPAESLTVLQWAYQHRDINAQEKIQVLEHMVRLGGTAILPLLLTELCQNSDTIRKCAAQALSGLGQPEWQSAIKGDDEDFHRLAHLNHNGAIQIMIDRLYSDSWWKRKKSAETLIRLASSPGKILISQWGRVYALITERHVDERTDEHRSSDCGHSDYHTDKGIGLPFAPQPPA